MAKVIRRQSGSAIAVVPVAPAFLRDRQASVPRSPRAAMDAIRAAPTADAEPDPYDLTGRMSLSMLANAFRLFSLASAQQSEAPNENAAPWLARGREVGPGLPRSEPLHR